MRAFGRLKNIDERKWKEWGHVKGLIEDVGRRVRYQGYAVRELRVKGTKGIVLKFPTLYNKRFNITPREEVRFVRRVVGVVNQRISGSGFELLKPIGHPVGPFIAMHKTNLPTITDFYENNLSPKVRTMLTNLSNELKVPEEKLREKIIAFGNDADFKAWEAISEGKVRLSNKYPASDSIERTHRGQLLGYNLDPLNPKHLQVVGAKNGVIQIVPYIDAA
jgi:hypothetical protein